ALEKRLASLEDAKYCLTFSSGMAAETTLLLSICEAGDHVIAFDDLYGGTRRLFDSVLKKFGVEFSYVDARDPLNVEKTIRKNTKLIWLETPTNPLMRMCDIREIAKIGHKRDVDTVVDNTFMSPYFQSPLDLDADMVIHSTTKYLGGHSDVVGGAIMLSDADVYEKIRFNQNAVGAIPSPFDCFLVLRGTKTLALRMEKHAENALQIAKLLQDSGKIKRVYYPGLKTHPQHKLATKQMRGFGGMLSFELNGDFNDAKNFLEKLQLFYIAESLGGVESLIEHPASMTHASISQEVREQIGITDSLIRISVGIEDIEDLIEDLENAL
ncbi:MAG: trans-sulfuration enzyme family protein, partial [Candidatus Thorarchaeota archaeon]